jgi:hypothetical protein
MSRVPPGGALSYGYCFAMVTADAQDADCPPDPEVQRGDQRHEQPRQPVSSGGMIHLGAGDINITGTIGSDAIIYTATALASGVIGNVAYDTLKIAVRRLRSYMRRGRGVDSREEESRESIVRSAVKLGCAKVGVTVPHNDDRCEIRCSENESRYAYHLYYRDLAVKVLFPKSDKLDECELEVTLYTPQAPSSGE